MSANVVGLGFTSFFTDISSEMVNSVVPLFLTFQLGFTQFEFGAFNGAYQALAGSLRSPVPRLPIDTVATRR